MRDGSGQFTDRGHPRCVDQTRMGTLPLRELPPQARDEDLVLAIDSADLIERLASLPEEQAHWDEQ